MTIETSDSGNPQFDKRQFNLRLTQLLHAEQFGEAETFLAPFASNAGQEMREICLGLKADAVVTKGWDKLGVEVAKLSMKKQITAVGLDLSSHVENPEDSNGWVEPGVETSYYSDGAYPFSTSGIDKILSELGRSSTPWQGCFEDIGWAIEITGLARLHSKIRELQERGDSQHDYDVAIGMAYLILCFHRSAVRDVRAQGLPQPMPLLMGEHDFGGPYIDAAYHIASVMDYSAQVEEALAGDKKAAQRRVRNSARTLIDEIRERRQHMLDWPQGTNPDKRQTFVEYCKSADAMWLKDRGVSNSKPTWEMGDAEFEDLLSQVWASFGLDAADMPRKQTAETTFGKLVGNMLFGKKGF